ncbi:GNAT family N-acetyltransferase [Actinokineospora globicatena]|uniref:GNAT family N-acetyltransferase n=1 Tax=Actinokineospora globicatena TaxID=103729 RepID=UPI0024A1568F|nr:Acetyltransferase (GNAT) family protein [Actinokineospora globicatena]GLW81399.1 N-acetyltransferase [Actinokineospora globicatena]GLW87903.1 N-acetyltransferase [Actinokineospora globicatena]
MRIEVRDYAHPDVVKLVAEVQQEYVVRYGGFDETPVDPTEFTHPSGLFLIGYLDDVPVASGGWRVHDPETVEMKRLYVTPAARGRGLARAMLAELERVAIAGGYRKLILETGLKQPEAVELYLSSGYDTIEPFGFYADAPLARHLGKILTP